MSLSSEWRQAAVDRWYASQDHVGQADTDPEPYIEAAADAAVLAVCAWLRHADRLSEIAGARWPRLVHNPLWDAAEALERDIRPEES